MNRTAEKIILGKPEVGVIGIGTHGLPLAANCANAGFVTLGFDSRPIRAEMINGRNDYIPGYSVRNYRDLWYGEILHGTTDFGGAASKDIVIICADDHIGASRFGDITPESCIEAVCDYMEPGAAAVFLSSPQFAVSAERLAGIISEKTGYKRGEGFVCAVGKADERGAVRLDYADIPAELGKFFELINKESEYESA